MKKLMMLAFAATLALSTAQADDKEEPAKKKGGNRNIVALVKQLDLDADQKKTLNAFMKEHREKTGDIRKLPKEERRAKYQENRKAIEAKLKEILNEEQQKKLKELMAKNRPAGKGKKPEKK